MSTHTKYWNLSDSFKNQDEVVYFLNFLIEEGDLEGFCDAVGTLVKERGISAVARDTGITRAGLYKSLSRTGKPKLETIAKIMPALGLTIKIEADARTPVPA